MSQNSLVLPTTGTVSGLQMTQFANNAIDTLNTLASGASAPSSPEAGQLWHDTANNLVKLRSLDNTAWIPFLQLSEAAYASLPYFVTQATGDLNKVINGGMSIDQLNEGASYSVPNTNTPTYAVDQWVVSCGCSGAGGVTAQRVADAPPGFSASLKVTVGTGAGSVGSTDFLYAYQPMEGSNLDDLNYGTTSALPLSLSFWVKSSVAGTFAAVLQNAAGSRAIVNKFTITTGGVWQQVLIPNVPGDQSGTYLTNAGAMLNLLVVMATGTTDQTSSLNSWLAGDWLGSTSQSNNVLTTSGASFQLTGVMLNPGIFCLPYQKRPIQQELILCQRYFEKTFFQGTAVAQNVGVGLGDVFIVSVNAATNTNVYIWPFSVRKRVAPTIVTYNPLGANGNWRDTTAGTDKAYLSAAISDWSAGLTVGAATTVGDNLRINVTANARM